MDTSSALWTLAYVAAACVVLRYVAAYAAARVFARSLGRYVRVGRVGFSALADVAVRRGAGRGELRVACARVSAAVSLRALLLLRPWLRLRVERARLVVNVDSSSGNSGGGASSNNTPTSTSTPTSTPQPTHSPRSLAFLTSLWRHTRARMDGFLPEFVLNMLLAASSLLIQLLLWVLRLALRGVEVAVADGETLVHVWDGDHVVERIVLAQESIKLHVQVGAAAKPAAAVESPLDAANPNSTTPATSTAAARLYQLVVTVAGLRVSRETSGDVVLTCAPATITLSQQISLLSLALRNPRMHVSVPDLRADIDAIKDISARLERKKPKDKDKDKDKDSTSFDLLKILKNAQLLQAIKFEPALKIEFLNMRLDAKAASGGDIPLEVSLEHFEYAVDMVKRPVPDKKNQSRFHLVMAQTIHNLAVKAAFPREPVTSKLVFAIPKFTTCTDSALPILVNKLSAISFEQDALIKVATKVSVASPQIRIHRGLVELLAKVKSDPSSADKFLNHATAAAAEAIHGPQKPRSFAILCHFELSVDFTLSNLSVELDGASFGAPADVETPRYSLERVGFAASVTPMGEICPDDARDPSSFVETLSASCNFTVGESRLHGRRSESEDGSGLLISASQGRVEAVFPVLLVPGDSIIVHGTCILDEVRFSVLQKSQHVYLDTIKTVGAALVDIMHQKKATAGSSRQKSSKNLANQPTRLIAPQISVKLRRFSFFAESADAQHSMSVRLSEISYAQTTTTTTTMATAAAVDSEYARRPSTRSMDESMLMEEYWQDGSRRRGGGNQPGGGGGTRETHLVDMDELNVFVADKTNESRVVCVKGIRFSDEDDAVSKVHVGRVIADWNLRHFHAIVVSCSSLGRAAGSLVQTAPLSSPSPGDSMVVLSPEKPKPLRAEIDQIDVSALLPEDVRLAVRLTKLTAVKTAGAQVICGVESALVRVPNPLGDTEQQLVTLVQVDAVTCVIRKASAGSSADKPGTFITRDAFKTDVGEVNVTIPNGLVLSDVIENAVNTTKVVKILLDEHFGGDKIEKSQKEYLDKIPLVELHVRRFLFRVDDSPFESAFNRNYVLGLQEQKQRISRQRAFYSKFAHSREIIEESQIRNYEAGPLADKITKEVIEAYYLLQKLNSVAWVKKRTGDAAYEAPPLMTMLLKRVTLKIAPPALPHGAATFEEAISIIDDQVPASNRYDEIIPRQILYQVEDVVMKLRDYPIPIVHLNSSTEAFGSYKGLKAEGLVILAEQLCEPGSARTVVVPIAPAVAPVTVARTINPVKCYSNMDICINTKKRSFFCWGPSIDPAFTDVSRIVDSFTKPNVDPSDPVAWWDKMRLLVHGRYKIRFTGGGSFRMRLLGSFSPYFELGRHAGSDGIELAFDNGSLIEVGGGAVNKAPGNSSILIECGEVKLVSPNSHSAKTAGGASKGREDVVMKYTGGVVLKIDVCFENYNDSGARLPMQSHHEIIMKTPEYVGAHLGTGASTYDAFRDFRSASLSFNFDIRCPGAMPHTLQPSLNYLHLNPYSFARLMSLGSIFTSPLNALGVRKGKLFDAQPQKKKISKLVRGIELRIDGSPVIVGLMHELDNAEGALGVRCRFDQFVANISINQEISLPSGEAHQQQQQQQHHNHQHQRLLSPMTPESKISASGSDVEDSVVQKAAEGTWSIPYANIEVFGLEARVASHGISMNEDGTIKYSKKQQHQQNQNQSSSRFDIPAVSSIGGEEYVAANGDWYNDEDAQTLERLDDLRMVPFCWAPKMVFTRNKRDMWSIRAEAAENVDLYATQEQLARKRLRQIDDMILFYMNQQKRVEARIVSTSDDSLKPVSAAIVKKMQALMEKRIVVFKYISRCVANSQGRARKHKSYNLSQSSITRPDEGRTIEFDNQFVVHNIHALWTPWVRNIVFKLFYLQTQNIALQYYLTNAAVKVVRELIDDAKKNESSKASRKQQQQQQTGQRTPPNERARGTRTGAIDLAEQLLNQLVADQEKHFVVENETRDEQTSPSHTSSSPTAHDESSLSPHARGGAFLMDSVYTASPDAASPDFLPSVFSLDSEFVVQLINPQINLEAYPKDNPSALEAVVLAAEGGCLQSIFVVDRDVLKRKKGYINTNDYNEALVKYRKVMKINNSQIYVARKNDVDSKIRENKQSQHTFANTDDDDNLSHGDKHAQWPLWAPLECLIDKTSPTGFLHRVVDQTSVSLHRDRLNPLYVRLRDMSSNSSSSATTTTSKTINNKDNSRELKDFTANDTIHFRFPSFVISVTSTEYSIFYNVIQNLMVYKEPESVERAEQLNNAMIAVEQVADLRELIMTLLDLQDKVRQLESFIRSSGSRRQAPADAAAPPTHPRTRAGSIVSLHSISQNSLSSAETSAAAEKVDAAKQLLRQYRTELYVIMEAVRQLKSLTTTRASRKAAAKTAWRVYVSMGQLMWRMLYRPKDSSNDSAAKETPRRASATSATAASCKDLCSWTLKTIEFTWEHKEDQSGIRTLEIDKMLVENKLDGPQPFRDLVAPYFMNPQQLDLSKQKMLRLYWREMAPVAGIPVVEHFELNVYPLILQVTYEVGKRLQSYFFPEKTLTDHVQASVERGIVKSASQTVLALTGRGGNQQQQSSSSGGADAGVTETAQGNADRGSEMATTDAPAPAVTASNASLASAAAHSITKKPHIPSGIALLAKIKSKLHNQDDVDEMRTRASHNRTYIYIKVPGSSHCLSYRGNKARNFEDLNQFVFRLPTLEYRNKTWATLELLEQLKRDVMRAALANTANLVREKLFSSSTLSSAAAGGGGGGGGGSVAAGAGSNASLSNSSSAQTGFTLPLMIKQGRTRTRSEVSASKKSDRAESSGGAGGGVGGGGAAAPAEDTASLASRSSSGSKVAFKDRLKRLAQKGADLLTKRHSEASQGRDEADDMYDTEGEMDGKDKDKGK